MIIDDPANASFAKKKWEPVYTAHKSARILIVGQAPGRLAQESGIPWNDLSGDNLRKWLGLTKEVFYDPKKVALVPMDFYFPGSKERGDIAPRKGFAEKWHPLILKQMPDIELIIVIGKYAQEYYLGTKKKASLTETVRSFKEYLPKIIPLVHPSPRNNIWQKKNPWFPKTVIPTVQKIVAKTLSSNLK
ncbi:MAG TPA: uracil-DNA glycosylase family protein [Candidatus Paceibacterota bacterium]|jgi:uracil-DNA glycosylase|nr:uracil-DNA glycosylase family protein [Candidatus Paceibacterota bacterium]